MSKITVDGLTSRQQLFADILWACDSRNQVDKFVQSLPNAELQQEVENLIELIILASFDQVEQDDLTEAKDLINKIKRG